jgi:hypothetical protein
MHGAVAVSRVLGMAGNAKRFLVEPEERRLRSAVRDVAARAALGCGGMTHLAGEVGRVVTALAEIFRGGLEERRMVGAVGVVARRALVEARMDVGRLGVELVAVEAELGLVFLQPQDPNQTMRFVAGRAISVARGGVG